MEIPREPKINLNFVHPDMRVLIPKEKLQKFWENRKTSLSEICTKLCLHQNAIYNFLCGIRSPPINFLLEIAKQEELSNWPIKFGHGGNAANALIPPLNPRIAYLVGALRDGTLNSNGKYEVCYYQKEVKWLNFLNNLIVSEFKPSNKPILVLRSNQTPKITMSNRPIYEYLRVSFDIPVGNKINWPTPKVILKAPKEIQKYYIRGFFDADGVSGQNVGFCQANLQSLNEIKSMLRDFGIHCRDKFEYRKTKKGKDFYYLYLKEQSKDDFFMLIGSSNISKVRNQFF